MMIALDVDYRLQMPLHSMPALLVHTKSLQICAVKIYSTKQHGMHFLVESGHVITKGRESVVMKQVHKQKKPLRAEQGSTLISPKRVAQGSCHPGLYLLLLKAHSLLLIAVKHSTCYCMLQITPSLKHTIHCGALLCKKGPYALYLLWRKLIRSQVRDEFGGC